MAKRRAKKTRQRSALKAPERRGRRSYKGKLKSNRTAHKGRRPGISEPRLERGLRVLSETKDIKAAARAIRVSLERFQRAAKRRKAIQKRNGFWVVVGRLPRKMPIFSAGRQLAITVRSSGASTIGRYMAAVGQFLQTNDPKILTEFTGRGVKDVRGKSFQFETDPNVLYRLSSAGGEPFEEMYRIVI